MVGTEEAALDDLAASCSPSKPSTNAELDLASRVTLVPEIVISPWILALLTGLLLYLVSSVMQIVGRFLMVTLLLLSFTTFGGGERVLSAVRQPPSSDLMSRLNNGVSPRISTRDRLPPVNLLTTNGRAAWDSPMKRTMAKMAVAVVEVNETMFAICVVCGRKY